MRHLSSRKDLLDDGIALVDLSHGLSATSGSRSPFHILSTLSVSRVHVDDKHSTTCGVLVRGGEIIISFLNEKIENNIPLDKFSWLALIRFGVPTKHPSITTTLL